MRILSRIDDLEDYPLDGYVRTLRVHALLRCVRLTIKWRFAKRWKSEECAIFSPATFDIVASGCLADDCICLRMRIPALGPYVVRFQDHIDRKHDVRTRSVLGRGPTATIRVERGIAYTGLISDGGLRQR